MVNRIMYRAGYIRGYVHAKVNNRLAIFAHKTLEYVDKQDLKHM